MYLDSSDITIDFYKDPLCKHCGADISSEVQELICEDYSGSYYREKIECSSCNKITLLSFNADINIEVDGIQVESAYETSGYAKRITEDYEAWKNGNPNRMIRENVLAPDEDVSYEQ